MKKKELELEAKLFSDIDTQGYSFIKKEELEFVKKNYDCKITKINGNKYKVEPLNEN